MPDQRDAHTGLHSEEGAHAGEHPGRARNPILKVVAQRLGHVVVQTTRCRQERAMGEHSGIPTYEPDLYSPNAILATALPGSAATASLDRARVLSCAATGASIGGCEHCQPVPEFRAHRCRNHVKWRRRRRERPASSPYAALTDGS